MKIKTLVVSILLLSIGIAAFGQKTKEQIMTEEYGKIRAEMVKKAANWFKYTDSDNLQKITSTDIYTFQKALDKKEETEKRLFYCIGLNLL